jgi:hypothetical protein
MNTNITNRYHEIRREHPFLPVKAALAWAKQRNVAANWDGDGHDGYVREIDGFTVRLAIEEESIFPIANRRGETDYGHYVEERGSRWGWDGDWRGNWPEPAEHAPLGLPYTSIRYSGPGWVQGESGGYFIPDGIKEQFDYYRRAGQSKSVAWDLTKQWVEDQITMLFSSPLTNCVVIVTAYKDNIELGSVSMGTDVSGDDDGRDYIFEMVEECGMIDDAIYEARENIERLTNTN